MKRVIEISFTVSLFTYGFVAQDCEKCVLRGSCKVFEVLNQQQQDIWQNRFPCAFNGNAYSQFHGRSVPNYVCCTDSLWRLVRSLQRTYQNPEYNQNVNNNFNTMNQGTNNLYNRPQMVNPPTNNVNFNPFIASRQFPQNNIRPRQQCPITSFPLDPESGCCGREHSGGDRIPGGKETELIQLPWTALLRSTFNYGDRIAAIDCGGSLISSRYVLTAAHCVFDMEGQIIKAEISLAEYDKRTFPTDCKVKLGEGQTCVNSLVMGAESVIIHPQYENQELINDIALIRLDGFVPYTDYIRPICLPSINVNMPEFSDLRLAVAGWGRNGQFHSDVKQSTVVNLVPQETCQWFYQYLTDRHLCAAGHSGQDTCKGDSGGPLMTLYGGKYEVVGVVSGKRSDAPCGTAVPSLYTSVYLYLDWIRANIKD